MPVVPAGKRSAVMSGVSVPRTCTQCDNKVIQLLERFRHSIVRSGGEAPRKHPETGQGPWLLSSGVAQRTHERSGWADAPALITYIRMYILCE